jgi:hypothetical protein
MNKEQIIGDRISAMRDWIDSQIAAIKSHNKPITRGSNEWMELIDTAMEIEFAALEKFGLVDYFHITKQDNNGETYSESTEAGTHLYYQIEGEVMDKFEVIDEYRG